MRVTFCVTCYDGDVHLLPKRLADIYEQQTVSPDEVLVITSGVASGAIVWNSNMPDLTIKTFENRMLPGGARNKGGEFATGDVICFCDVDDPIHPQKCEVIKRVFDNKDVDALLHSYNLDTDQFSEIEDLDNIELERVIEVDPRWEQDQKCTPPIDGGYYCIDGDLPHTNIVTPSGRSAHHGHISVRKEICNEIKYIEHMRIGEDGAFCQSVVKSNKFSLYYTPLILINYMT
jgi:glycosyltransferase involved in cell wall biosynthesis